jgi:hypothetical protein
MSGKLDLRNTGPFTAKEAAERVMQASRELKWFTLCHPHWYTAYVHCDLATGYPIPALPIPKGVQLMTFKEVEGDFKPTGQAAEMTRPVTRALPRLAHLARLVMGSDMASTDSPDRAGLTSLWLFVELGDPLELQARVAFPAASKTPKDPLQEAIKEACLPSVPGWKFDGFSTDSQACFKLRIQRNDLGKFEDVVGRLFASLPQPPKRAHWFVDFGRLYQKKEDVRRRNWVELRPEMLDAAKIEGEPAELIALVNDLGLPTKKVSVEFDVTVDKPQDFQGVFELAALCKWAYGRGHLRDGQREAGVHRF